MRCAVSRQQPHPVPTPSANPSFSRESAPAATADAICRSDTAAQMHRFLAVLAQHRETLEQQREDIEMSLAEIAAHEDECRRLLAAQETANG